jgi:chemotaxis protein CheY-P-specific phosphatase CheC
MRLSDYELDITKELISIALANAADAFSKMAGEKVLVNQFNLTIAPPEASPLLPDASQEPLHILTTEVKGTLEGKSYLIFDAADTHRIFRVFAPGKEIAADGSMDELQQALLLELDNILSAAVITQLSNFLDVSIYGDVPGLRTMNCADALACFGKETGHFGVVFHINARFKSYQTNLQPVFIWFFKSDFLLATRQLVKNKKQLSLLKKSLVKPV